MVLDLCESLQAAHLEVCCLRNVYHPSPPHQCLPQFIPKANIEFKTVLGSLNRKLVELQNPNPFPIRYNVTLEVRDKTRDHHPPFHTANSP